MFACMPIKVSVQFFGTKILLADTYQPTTHGSPPGLHMTTTEKLLLWAKDEVFCFGIPQENYLTPSEFILIRKLSLGI